MDGQNKRDNKNERDGEVGSRVEYE